MAGHKNGTGSNARPSQGPLANRLRAATTRLRKDPATCSSFLPPANSIFYSEPSTAICSAALRHCRHKPWPSSSSLTCRTPHSGHARGYSQTLRDDMERARDTLCIAINMFSDLWRALTY